MRLGKIIRKGQQKLVKVKNFQEKKKKVKNQVSIRTLINFYEVLKIKILKIVP